MASSRIVKANTCILYFCVCVRVESGSGSGGLVDGAAAAGLLQSLSQTTFRSKNKRLCTDTQTGRSTCHAPRPTGQVGGVEMCVR